MMMLKRIMMWLSLAIIVVVVGIYIFLSMNGRRLFNEQASALTRYKVTVEAIAPVFPIGIELKGRACSRDGQSAGAFERPCQDLVR
jgi:heme/copper-type cytochrome/quinol oxidase subunit 2